MWLENEKIREIDKTVCQGERRGLSRLLEIFCPENQKPAPDLKVCPTCKKPLERKMLPYLEYFIHACPDRHGAWMSAEVSAKVRHLVRQQMSFAGKKQVIWFLASFFAFLIFFVLLTHLPQWLRLLGILP